jgi:hypothetical protein
MAMTTIKRREDAHTTLINVFPVEPEKIASG